VTVADQAIVDGRVTIAQVVSATSGWLVIHAQRDGQPGEVLGYSPVKEGDNADVVVLIDAARATGTLYAMLHSDAGTVGTYEFPGSDGPVLVGDQMVNPTFQITGGLAAAPSATTPSETAVPPEASGTAPAVAVGEGEVELEDFQFRPKVLTVRMGTTVKFANKDRVQHTVTSDTNLFDSGFLSKGDAFRYTFTEVGEYPYYCVPHGGPGGAGMAGKIIVVP
jgi:plastocyanin